MGAERKGVATAKNDNIIQLEIPSRHRWDVQHYTDSILAIGFAEGAEEQAERTAKCRRLLSEPTAARQACLELESLGKQGIPGLEEGLASANPEIQFYAAYSLAYLDHPPAAKVLGALARTVPEFRPLCLTGLQLLSHYSAKEELDQLLHEEVPELRYGALLALRRRDAKDDSIQGVSIGDLTDLVMIPSPRSMIAVSLQERPEIVIFGENSHVQMKDFFEVNSRLTMRSEPDGQIRLVRFQPSDEDRTAIVDPDVASVLEGFRAIGGTYNDIVCWLDEASRQGWVASPIAINPRPMPGRVYRRDGSTASGSKDPSDAVDIAQSPEDRTSKKSWWAKK